MSKRFIRPVAVAAAALTISMVSVPMAAIPAEAATTPVPVCAGARGTPVVDVTQDVRNEAFLPARDGRMWAKFSYTQRLRIWKVGSLQHCVRKDYEGTWTSIAGNSPGLTGTLSSGVTGTFTNTEFYRWSGELVPIAPTSGHLGEVDANCTADNGCANDDFLLVTKFYFSQGTKHCQAVRVNLEIDGGEHGHISFIIDRSPFHPRVTGDITG